MARSLQEGHFFKSVRWDNWIIYLTSKLQGFMVSENKVEIQGWGCSLVEECLSSMCEALGSIPSTTRKEQRERERRERERKEREKRGESSSV
jgi:hypothetical protein